ncbi:MAG: hypothetical protein ACJAZ9_002167 [Neolewinella sp.]|jgi:hypothetical protein
MRALKIPGFILLSLLLLVVVAVSFFGGSIAKAVVNSLNKNLQTEIIIAKYDVSIWSNFPKLSVNLQDVQVEGSDGSEFLVAEEVSCLLDLGSLWGKIRVEEVVVSDGKLQLLTDVDGNTNYQLAGYSTVAEQAQAEDTGEATEFAIVNAEFKGVEVVYRDEQLRIDFTGSVDRADFSGDFGADTYLLSANGVIDVHYLEQEGTRYLNKQQLKLTTETKIDNRDGSYTFAPMEVEVGDLIFNVIGDMANTEDGLRTNLRLESSSGSLEDVISLIPPAFVGGLSELETRGELLLTSTIAGNWTQNSYPRIDGRLTFTDGRVGSPRTNIGAKDLNLKATFTYLDGAKGGVQSFAIEELTGVFRGERFKMSLGMEDLEDPKIIFTANGALPLGTLPAILGESALTDGDGYVRIDEVRIAGRYADMLRPRSMGRVSASGRLTFDDAQVTINDRELDFPSGVLELRDNELALQDFTFQGPGTDISFTGKATNLIPVLFADSLNSNDAELIFDAKLTGNSLDIDELLNLASPSEEEEEIAAKAGQTDSLRAKTMTRRTYITDLLRGRFDASLDEWNYGEVEGENFRGQLIFAPRKLDLTGLTDAMSGELGIDCSIFFEEYQRVEARVSCKKIDVEAFFAQSENFGQEVLTSDNIEGEMDAKIFIQAYFDELGNFDYEKLKVKAGMSILKGELHGFEMLENFAFALKSGDLERVRFTKMQNYFEIENETLYIPAMFIQSSALNLEISGNHTFNNFLDYYIKVNAGQAIKNKISKHDDDLEVLPAQRNGFFNLYYTIHGPLDEYTVESNKRAVKNDFKRSLYRKGRVKQALERVFSEPIELVDEMPLESADAGGE